MNPYWHSIYPYTQYVMIRAFNVFLQSAGLCQKCRRYSVYVIIRGVYVFNYESVAQ
jgi:hypothetical protein